MLSKIHNCDAEIVDKPGPEICYAQNKYTNDCLAVQAIGQNVGLAQKENSRAPFNLFLL